MIADMEQRESQPERKTLVSDPDEIARIESENTLRQKKFIEETIERILHSGTNFLLKPSLISELNRLVIQGLSDLPGVYRPGNISITNSKHNPPPPEDVHRLVEEMCDYVNEQWERDPWHLSAYLMWRLNWIHPFEDGNGRTSRAISYIILCLKFSYNLPGNKTIPEVILENKQLYYDAIDAADAAERQGRIDLTAMEAVLKSALDTQLSEYRHTSTGSHLAGNERPKGGEKGQPPARWTSKLHDHYDKYPFWYWCIGIIIALAFGALL